jgi:hypothetical protein
MRQHDRELLKHQIDKLSHLKTQLDEQDKLIERLAANSQSWEGASDSFMHVMRGLFRALQDALPEDKVSFIDNDDLTVLRSQIVSARSKLSARIGTIHNVLGLPRPSEIHRSKGNQIFATNRLQRRSSRSRNLLSKTPK